MKKVIAGYIELANILDDAGHEQEAQEFTERAVKLAQTHQSSTNPRKLESFKSMVNQDAGKATDLIMQAMKGEISKDMLNSEIKSMLKKQESYKKNENISKHDEDILLNSIVNNNKTKSSDGPKFKTVQEARNYYSQKHVFRTTEEAEQFEKEKNQFFKSQGR